MKRISIFALFIALILISVTTAADAAANPISPPSASSGIISPAGSPPATYVQAIKILQNNKYGENEIKSFVYQIFSLFDRHADISSLLLLFADEDLYMQAPEGRIDSHQAFEKWYADIGAKYQSNVYTLEKVDVQFPANGKYQVDLIVTWQALARDGKYTSFRSRQQWKIVDGGGYWPRIVSYVVEPAL